MTRLRRKLKRMVIVRPIDGIKDRTGMTKKFLFLILVILVFKWNMTIKLFVMLLMILL